jgi:hypothetical protein
MNICDAAEQVLRRAGTALTAKDITKMILDAGLWQTSGKTPGVTVAASLFRDIKKNGDKSKFVKVTPNTFVLRNANGCKCAERTRSG